MPAPVVPYPNRGVKVGGAEHAGSTSSASGTSAGCRFDVGAEGETPVMYGWHEHAWGPGTGSSWSLA
jgi:hypothetical protein